MNKSERGARWQSRARESLAGGISSQFRSADPVVFSHGHGSRIWDVDGNEFIDFTLSQGPLIHGHSHPGILCAVAESLGRGQVWNGLHTEEIELAETLVRAIPCADQIRLGCTGSEAVQAALRLARAFTGRTKIVKFEGHYHGWLDSVAVSINPPLDRAGPRELPDAVPWTAGVSQNALMDILVLPWNDLTALESIMDAAGREIAAVIGEACMCNSGCIEPAQGFLSGLRQLCDKHGIVLIFDEVITGFRFALGGAQEYYGVTPDLAIFGKAVANGFPLSVLAGRANIMKLIADGSVIHAGTLNAHVGGVAAARASIELLTADRSLFSRLHGRGEQLMQRLVEAAHSAGHAVCATGPGAVFHFGFLRTDSGQPPVIRDYRDIVRLYDMDKYARFVRSMADRGVRLIGRGIWYLSTVHSDADLDMTVEAARQTLHAMKSSD